MREYFDVMPDEMYRHHLNNTLVNRCFHQCAIEGKSYTKALEFLALNLINMNEAHRENLIRTAANAAL